MPKLKLWCAVPGCHSDARKTPDRYPFMKDVSFLPFPSKKQGKRRRKWLNAIRRPLDYDPKPWHRVCSRHFDEVQDTPSLFPWNNYGKQVMLRDNTSILKRKRATNEIQESAYKPTEVTDSGLSNVSTSNSNSIDFDGSVDVGDVVSANDMPVFIKEVEIISEDIKAPGATEVTVHDHTYSHGSGVRTTGLDHSTVTVAVQTDITLNDMKQYDEKSSRDSFLSIITSSDKKVKYYTGIPNLIMFFGLFNILNNCNMKYYSGKQSVEQKQYEVLGKKPGPARKLSKLNEFILTLIRLRHALPILILADLFHISGTRVSQIFTTWTIHMSMVFSRLLVWPKRSLVQKHMPLSIKKKYPKLRAIIDCTEFFVQRPRNPSSQARTYSTYKSHNTCKCLVSITPSGAFNFVSDIWGGNVSDRHITMHSGFLDLISPEDEIMADRGFLIRDLLTERRASLTIPPFTRKCKWGKGKYLTGAEIRRTRYIANIRIHVERAIQRLKQFKLVSGIISWTLKPLINPMVKTAAFLCNLMKPLVKKK